MTNKKNRFLHWYFPAARAGGGDVSGAVSAGGQPDGAVFWYDCLSGMAGL